MDSCAIISSKVLDGVKAVRRLIVNKVTINGSGSHAAMHKSSDLSLGSFLVGITRFMCGVLERVHSPGTTLRKVAHHLLASLLLASEALFDHVFDHPLTHLLVCSSVMATPSRLTS